jgi:glycogen debranching enzyme
MTISYDRSMCCDLNETTSREWLVTNGLGGYAAGTIAGMLTRMEHGLLVAPLAEVTTPQLLFAKIDEEVVFDERTYYLGTNEYRDGTLNPAGFVYLETFRLEEGFPVFTYHIGGIDGIMLEKRIWMPQERHTTYVQYRLLRTTPFNQISNGRNGLASSMTGYGRYEYAEAAQRTLTLTLLPFAAYRPHQTPQYGNLDWHFQVQPHRSRTMEHGAASEDSLSLPPGVVGCTIRAWEGAHPYHLLAVSHPESQTTFIPTNVWYWHFLRRHDASAGRPAIDDLYLPGVIRATLWPGEDAILTIILTAEELAAQPLRPQQLNLSYTHSVEEQRQIASGLLSTQRFFGESGEAMRAYPLKPLPITGSSDTDANGKTLLSFLLQAANRFQAELRLSPEYEERDYPFFPIRARSTPVVLADFYSMEMRTRDTLIALPGLLLSTQRYDKAYRLLRDLARHFKQGMLPDRWPLPFSKVTERDYTSVDTSLWFFYALDAYLQATHDYELLDELYHRLVESIQWYTQGNNAGISIDPRDGLLRVQPQEPILTWMNARVDEAPVTPRYGKAVEVNALWYNALALLDEWSHLLYRLGRLGHIPSQYQEQLTLSKQSFQQRFWYAKGGYLYDVVDGPDGNDHSMRPNQLFAISLRHPVLEEAHRAHVLDAVTHHLLTPYGLRTLATHEMAYRGHIGRQQDEQAQSIHQGSIWTWLIGPYFDAFLTTHGVNSDSTLAPSSPSRQHPQDSCDLTYEYIWRKGVKLLTSLQEHFYEDLQGMIGGVFDGDAPHYAGYSVASVLCTGELLRLYTLLAGMQARQVYGDRIATSFSSSN